MAVPHRRHHQKSSKNSLINNEGSVEKVSAASFLFLPTLNKSILNEVNEEDNFVYSPLGVHLCLSVMRSGAEEATEQELSRAANYSQTSIHEMNEGYRAIIQGLTADAPCLFAPNTALKPTIHFITCLYIPPRFDNLNAQFVENVQHKYNCRVIIDDLKNKESVNRINAEVQLATEGTVTSVLDHANFSSDQKYGPNIGMVMVNVLHFRSLWEGNNGFDRSDTRMMEFTKIDGSKMMVPMMQNKKMYASYSNNWANDCSIAALYFEGGRYCLMIYRPFRINGSRILPLQFAIPYLERNMTKLTMDKISADFVLYHRQNYKSEGKLHVSLPRFTANLNVSLKYALNNNLNNLSVKNTFNSARANFSGIRPMNADGSEQLYLSDCIHTVVVNIDETSAPATPNIPAYSPKRPRTSRRVKTFCVNEPFMFSIYDYINNVTIAHGSVYDPLQENSSIPARLN